MIKKVPLTEWLVVVFDRSNVNRLLYRSQHLARIPQLVELGVVTNVGPIFADTDKTKFVGSSYNLRVNSRQEAVDFLKQDIFYKEGIWDVENAIIYPYTVVSRAAQAMK